MITLLTLLKSTSIPRPEFEIKKVKELLGIKNLEVEIIISPHWKTLSSKL